MPSPTPPSAPAEATFQSLPPADRALLSLLAASGAYLSRTRLLKAAATAGIDSVCGNLSQPLLKRYIDRWLTSHLVLEHKRGIACSPRIADDALWDAADSGRLEAFADATRRYSELYGGAAAAHDYRLARFGLGHAVRYLLRSELPDEYLLDAIGWFPSSRSLESMSDDLATRYLNHALEFALEWAIPLAETVAQFAKERTAQADATATRAAGRRGGASKGDWKSSLAVYHALRGELAQASAAMADDDSPDANAARVVIHAAEGDLDAARRAGTACLAAQRKRRRRKVYVPGLGGLLWVPITLSTGTGEDRACAINCFDIARTKRDHLADVFDVLQPIVSQEAAPQVFAERFGGQRRRWIPMMLKQLVAHWRGHAIPDEPRKDALAVVDRLERNGFHWPAAEWKALLKDSDSTTGTLAGLLSPKPAWEEALDGLEALCALPSAQASESSKADSERLVWNIRIFGTHVSAEPRLQKQTKKGWTAGRAVALRRLADPKLDEPWHTHHDRRAASYITEIRDGWGYSPSLVLRSPTLALAGHPLVFWADGSAQATVEIVRAEPKLRVVETAHGIALSLVPPPPKDTETVNVQEGMSRILVYTYTGSQRRLGELVGRELEVPRAGRDRMTAVLGRAASIIGLHSDIECTDASVAERKPDPTIYAQLWRQGVGLRVRFAVYPLGRGGPGFEPGTGARRVTAALEGEPVACTRELDGEVAHLHELRDSCPALAAASRNGRDYHLVELEDCLELLTEFGARNDVRVEWMAGQKLSITGRRGLRDVRLSVSSRRDWLVAKGELPVDDQRVLSMRNLLQSLSRGTGRFVEVGDDEYLALTDDLRRRLAALDAFATHDKRRDNGAEELTLHGLAAVVLDEWSETDAKLSITGKAKTALAKVREALELTPAVPARFEADLRDYQRDGYDWMSRLAHWGAGACLADDMGLGKTIQALAVLVDRADGGPALVVAPTSVCANWMAEAHRFAPTMRMRAFASASREEREQLVNKAGSHDVVVVSYTMLAQAEGLFAGRRWHTLILDEAQAIKNARTQRAQQARDLEADFRLATTGTPVENHVGDLWSLFSVLNPGLLGSKERFEREFAGPIHRQSDRQAAQRLKRLIRPFILRRRKSEVLAELPSRTETTLRIEPYEEERSLYEALRQDAVKRLASGAKGPSRIKIFAELMRLRRAACHPELAAPGSGFASAKHDALDALLEELRSGGHRALVFSQFVDHLALVRCRLDAEDVPYQYLDGSTPAASRADRVAAFQAGQGDFFLISLKAGGSGLNLTGADYVIHLDPWWNPAVEDQASDRAHRIGQTRPVTIYRLVAAGTIEDQIVALHGEKRELADQLLEGTERTVRLDPDSLLALLQDDRQAEASPRN